MILMIWCLKIWWRYINSLHWNMLETWLNWWCCEDLMFHVLFKPRVCAISRLLMKKTSLKIGAHSVDHLPFYRCIGSYWCLLIFWIVFQLVKWFLLICWMTYVFYQLIYFLIDWFHVMWNQQLNEKSTCWIC